MLSGAASVCWAGEYMGGVVVFVIGSNYMGRALEVVQRMGGSTYMGRVMEIVSGCEWGVCI